MFLWQPYACLLSDWPGLCSSSGFGDPCQRLTSAKKADAVKLLRAVVPVGRCPLSSAHNARPRSVASVLQRAPSTYPPTIRLTCPTSRRPQATKSSCPSLPGFWLCLCLSVPVPLPGLCPQILPPPPSSLTASLSLFSRIWTGFRLPSYFLTVPATGGAGCQEARELPFPLPGLMPGYCKTQDRRCRRSQVSLPSCCQPPV